MGKKKQFINKAEAQTFRLVHRSQKDPMIADEAAGARVFAPVQGKNDKDDGREKFGIYYNDDYDYLQHLRSANEAVGTAELVDRTVIRVPGKPMLPSSMFETKGIELKEGLLNQAAPVSGPRPDLDPDILRALDGEIDEDDELEDDFFALANEGMPFDDPDVPSSHCAAPRRRKFSDENESDSEKEETDDDDDLDSMGDFGGDEDSQWDDKKTRFTNYSMCSAVIKREGPLQLLDDRFEKLYEQYDEDQMGELEMEEEEEMGGFLEPDSLRIQNLVKQHEQKKSERGEMPEADDIARQITLAAAARDEEDDNLEQLERISIDAPGTKKAKWDCQSILSTYSNLYNHPTVLSAPSTRKRKLCKKDLDDIEMMDDTMSVMTGRSTCTVRPKGETAEERRERKKMVKEERRERRQEKKSNKEAFKDMKKVVDRQVASVQPKSKRLK